MTEKGRCSFAAENAAGAEDRYPILIRVGVTDCNWVSLLPLRRTQRAALDTERAYSLGVGSSRSILRAIGPNYRPYPLRPYSLLLRCQHEEVSARLLRFLFVIESMKDRDNPIRI